jgi:hypothetical protein
MKESATNNDQTVTAAAGDGAAVRTLQLRLWQFISVLALGMTLAFALGTMTEITFADPLPDTPTATSSTMYTLTQVYQSIAGEIDKLASTTIATGTSAFGIDGTMYPGTTVVTGQTVCYDAAGSSISCTGTGQDGEIQAGLAFDYTDNGDGTVTDNNTGLTWQQGYSTSTMTWSAAATSCANNDANLPGTGWRLPNIKELFTLVDFTVSGVAKIDLTAFPGTPASDFWSATTYPDSGSSTSRCSSTSATAACTATLRLTSTMSVASKNNLAL